MNEAFSTVTRARSKSRTTPNTGFVTILYKLQVSSIKSVSQVLTDALLSTTVYFSALTCVRGKSHTTPNTGVSKISTNMRSVSATSTDASLNTTESLSAVTCARRKSHASPITGCVGILRLYKCQVNWVNPHTCTCKYHRAFSGSDSCV